jgi:hypothetical protein
VAHELPVVTRFNVRRLLKRVRAIAENRLMVAFLADLDGQLAALVPTFEQPGNGLFEVELSDLTWLIRFNGFLGYVNYLFNLHQN